jgi:hypothetical protein
VTWLATGLLIAAAALSTRLARILLAYWLLRAARAFRQVGARVLENVERETRQ